MEPVTSGEERRSDLAAVEPAAAELRDGPLQGIKVVEFGQLLAGPYVGTLLGDFGAEVIKIEAPPAGDPMREWGRLRHNDRSMWWSILSRNKQSVTLNLRLQEGQRIAANAGPARRRGARELPPGDDGAVGTGPRGAARAQPRSASTRGSPATARPAGTATGPGSRPPRRRSRAFATSTATPTRPRPATASRSVTRSPRSRPSPGSCSPCMPATRAVASARWSTPRSPMRASR